MSVLSRRRFIGGLSAVTIAGALASCSESPPPEPGGAGGTGGGGSGLRWWDHFGGLQDLHADWAEDWSQELGVNIEYSYNEPARATEALQLANQSNQLPDVYSNIVGLPLPALVEAGWLGPIEISDKARGRLPEDAFTDGISMLDGKIYGLPVLSDKQYWACTWFNKDIAEAVGFEGPKSYDELRAALQAIADHGEYAPMTLALGDSGRMTEQVDDLAQAAGFPGREGQRYDTGEYAYHHESYIEAIEFLKEISDSGWLLPGTNALGITDSRGRWAAGNIGFYLDGPWSPGGCRALNPDHLPRMATSGLLTPGAEELIVTRGAPEPTWFVAGNTVDAKAASGLVESFTRDDYQMALAEAMDQPPINLDVVEQADVIEPYAWLVEDFKKRVFRAPEPQVRNIDVTEAQALVSPVSPELGSIVQGYLGGDLTDLKGELTQLSEAHSAALDKAIEQAKSQGADVSREDWAFPDWERGTDYTY